MRFSLRASVLCVALILSGIEQARTSARPWLEIRTAHFRIITDAGEKRGSEVASHCERMRAAFSMLMPGASADDPAPLLILALKSQQEVDDLVRDRGTQFKHAGIFLPGADESFILLDASGNPWRTVYHEFAHELLHANTSAAVQTWFEEGLGEYLSTIEVTANGTEIGLVPIGELQFLRQNGKLMRLSDLVRVNPSSAAYNQNGPTQSMFYAQSWLLVHYLFDHGLVNRAQSFFASMAGGAALDDAILQSFRMNTEQLERQLLEYARGEQFRYFSLVPTEAHSAPPVVEPLSQATASGLQLEIRWHLRIEHSKDEAVALAAAYRLLLHDDPENVEVLRGLGVALLELVEHQQSFEVLRRAVQLQPDSALNHHALAKLLNVMDAAGLQNSHAGFSAAHEAEICLSLDPHYADAYRLKASALARDGRFDESVAMMRKAISLSPRMEGYELELADIELRQHDYRPALALLQHLKNSHDPEVVKQADYFLSSSAQAVRSGN